MCGKYLIVLHSNRSFFPQVDHNAHKHKSQPHGCPDLLVEVSFWQKTFSMCLSGESMGVSGESMSLSGESMSVSGESMSVSGQSVLC